jgi:hypothetical protein
MRSLLELQRGHGTARARRDGPTLLLLLRDSARAGDGEERQAKNPIAHVVDGPVPIRALHRPRYRAAPPVAARLLA